MYWRSGPRLLRRQKWRLKAPRQNVAGLFIFHRRVLGAAQQEQIMAKEHQRSNREAKKPKAVKPVVATDSTPMSLGRLTPIKPAKNAR
jgi:hypothetical protein